MAKEISMHLPILNDMDTLHYYRGDQGKCPHCGVTVMFISPDVVIHSSPSPRGFIENKLPTELHTSGNGYSDIMVAASKCPGCGKPIIALSLIPDENFDPNNPMYQFGFLIYPRNEMRFVPKEVPENVSRDFIEASEVLPISEKASAALSRRCLQQVLRENGFTGGRLIDSINKAIESLPSHIAGNLDAIRNFGNFGAHPIKDINSGEIIDVEPEEAEFCLDILESLFDFFYVQPAESKAKKDKLEKKLIASGKINKKD